MRFSPMLLGAVVFASCAVDITGAPCAATADCPLEQTCNVALKLCQFGSDAGGGSGGGSVTGGGSGGGGGQTGGGGGGQATGDLIGVATANANFSILVQALTRAGLVSALQNSTTKTLFAPTNAAFASLVTELGIASVDELTVEQLRPILLYHVLGTEFRASAALTAAQANARVDSLGGKLQLSLSGSTIRLDNRASVVTANVLASNGVIHAIDKVILPSINDIATTTADLSSLSAALVLADTGTPSAALVAALDNDAAPKVTLFAPNDAAFTTLVTALKGSDNGAATGISALTSFRPDQLLPVLKYHLAPARTLAAQVPTTATKLDTLGGKVLAQRTGTAVSIDGVQVVQANLLASNGVIHVIGSVLLPSITDIATTTPTLSNMVAALQLADTGTPSPGLVAGLDNDTAAKVTVFAPNDAAVTNLLSALKGNDNGATTGISSLSSFRPDQLLPLLSYHVATANLFAAQVPTTATPINTLGGRVLVARNGTLVTVDGESVTTANLFASNGTVHVINSVLLPSATDVVTTSAQFSSLKSAVLAADAAAGTTPKLAPLLDGTTLFTLFAPSNAAFTALGAAPSGQSLTNVLAYHAVPGPALLAAPALALSAPTTLTTAFGTKTLQLSAEGVPRALKVMDSTATRANVVAVNYFTRNGVIHVVNKVLIPSP